MRADGTITHTLSTTLIGPDGKVLKFYPGNEWTPEQVVADVKQSPRALISGNRCEITVEGAEGRAMS